MGYDQLYVTGCRRGVTGNSGFQTLAMSAGISSLEREQIEGLVGYKKPLDLPESLAPDTVKDAAPVNFGYARLESGRWCLFQSVCAKRDSSNRSGNYFAHAIVGEDGTLAELPHRYWQSPTFVRSAKEVEERVLATGDCSLSALEPAALVPGQRIPLVAVATPEMVEALLTAACCSPKSGRRVVLAAAPGEAMYWYARVSETLPPRWAMELTFCTYVFDPLRLHTRLHLMAVRRGQGTFEFNHSDRDYTAYVFDFDGGSFSQLPDMAWADTPGLEALAEDATLPQSESELRGALAFAAMIGEPARVLSGEAVSEAVAYLAARQREGRVLALHRSWLKGGEMAAVIAREVAPDYLRAIVMLSGAQNGASWEDMCCAARRIFEALLFRKRPAWREALSASLQACGEKARAFAGTLLDGDFLSKSEAFVRSESTEAVDAMEVCAFLVEASTAAGKVEPAIATIIARSVPAFRNQTGSLGCLVNQLPKPFHAQMLTRALQDDESLAWLAGEMSQVWGPEPTQILVTLARSDRDLSGAPLFASFLLAVAVRELGDGKTNRFEAIAKLLRRQPPEMQAALVLPKLFAVISQLAPESTLNTCRRYLGSPPRPDANLGPVLDVLERGIDLVNPPRWLAGKRLNKLLIQRRAWSSESDVPSSLACLLAMQLLDGGTPAQEVETRHPQLKAVLADLPDETWEKVAYSKTRRFALRKVRSSDCAAFLRMYGGKSPARVAQIAGWMAIRQMPSLLRRGNFPSLHALLATALGSSWPDPTARKLRRTLTEVLVGAKESTRLQLRKTSLSAGTPWVYTFLEELPLRGGVFWAIIRKFGRR